MAQQAEWLVMLYMSADADNLAEPLQHDLRELGGPLQGAQLDNEVVVVAAIESGAGFVRRERIGTDGRYPLEAHQPCGDYPLYDFVRQTSADYSAKRRLLVLWGHSAGIGDSIQPAPPGAPAADGIRAADNRGGLGPPGNIGGGARLRRGLRADDAKAATWPMLDIVGFDACYISSVELAAHVHQYLGEQCHYLVSPESSISLNGWRYDWLMQRLAAQPTVGAETLARDIVSQVGRTPSAPRMLTLLDLSQLEIRHNDSTDGLIARMWPWVTELRDALEHRRRRQAVLDAFFATHWAGVRQFLDLSDLCRRLAQLPEGSVPGAVLRARSRHLLEYLTQQDGFVLDHAVSAEVVLGGVSIYCPWMRASAAERRRGARDVEMSVANYSALELPKQTGWWDVMNLPEVQPLVQRRQLEQALGDVQTAATAARTLTRRRGRGSETKPSNRETKPSDRETKWGDREVLPAA
jgi:hypothetical protein